MTLNGCYFLQPEELILGDREIILGVLIIHSYLLNIPCVPGSISGIGAVTTTKQNIQMCVLRAITL